jgi:transglutaminase-like putative cysteine protease
MESTVPTSESTRIRSAPVPADITLVQIPDSDPSPKEPASVLLLERHTRVPSREVLTRTVRRLHTPQGVQDQSRVEITFDPATEEITLHQLQIIRDGVARESLQPSDFRLIQRETQLEAHIQDGRVSAIAQLEDIRPGDIIDLAFTTRNRSPAFEGKYFFGFTLGWPCPITEVILTATLPAASPIVLRNTGLGSEPRRVNLPDGGERLVWHLRKPKPVPPDPTIPSWHIPIPYVQASDFADWNTVAAHTYRLWEPSLRSPGKSPVFLELVADLKKGHESPEAFAEAAIHFVQDQVRYLGIEDGIRSFVPEKPEIVLARRFGDCKDKSLVLCALLRANGITAWPVLVNSKLQHAIAGFLPSPAAFDHVIVCLRIGEQYFWVDPTVPAQGGTLETRTLPRFIHGLIVHPKSKGLVKLPKPTPDSGELLVQEDYAIDYRSKSALLSSVATHRGTQADTLRQTLGRAGHEGADKELLQSIQRLFPGAARECPLAIEDDRSANRITVSERFVLPEFVAPLPKSRQEGIRIPGHYIARTLVGTSENRREHPFHLPFPNRILHIITVSLPEGSHPEKSRETIEGPGFVFSSRTGSTHNGLEIRYSHVATANRVEAADFPNYMSKLNRVLETLGVVIPLPAKAITKKNKTLIGIAAGIAIVGVLGLLVKVVIGDGRPEPLGFDPLDDEASTLTTIDQPTDDEGALFDQNISDGIRDVLNDPGTVDIGGPSLLDAREFDFSLDPSATKDAKPSKIDGLPSLIK